MKFLATLIALAASGFDLALGAPEPATLRSARDANNNNNNHSACDPYTDWGHTQGAKTFYCHNFAPTWYDPPDFRCVSFKSADYCSGKNHCSDDPDCPGGQVCRWGMCLEIVNGKHCQRTCTWVS